MRVVAGFIKRNLKWIIPLFIFILLGSLYFIISIFQGRIYWAQWTGLYDVEAWDIINLLVIPVSLAGVIYFLQYREKNIDRLIAEEKQRETDFQEYFAFMSDLFKGIDFDNEESVATIRPIAQVKTSTLIPKIDKERLNTIIAYLGEVGALGNANYRNPTITLSRLDLSNRVLNYIQFNYSNMPFSNFRKSDLSFMQFKNANLYSCNFNNTIVFSADYSNATLTNSNFIGSDLTSTIFTGAKLRGADFSNSNLSYTDFSNANLHLANLENCNLSDSDFSNANLKQANFTDAKFNKGTTWPDGFEPDAAFAIQIDK